MMEGIGPSFPSKTEYLVCRFCGSQVDSVIPIFGEDGTSLELNGKIAQYLPVIVTHGDTLPQGLCYPCVDLLQTWDSFVRMCVQNDAKLRGLPEVTQTEVREEPVLVVMADGAENSEPDNDNFLDSDNEPLTAKIPIEKRMNIKMKIKSGEFSSDPEFRPYHGKRRTRKLDAQFTCDSCGRLIRTKMALAAHIKACINKEGLACDLCGSVYRSQLYLNRHVAKEHNNKLEECKHCHNFFSGNKMRHHLKTMHKIKTKNFVSAKEIRCKYCSEVFFNRYLRSEHVKNVHMQEELQCDQCDFQGRRDQVMRHAKNRHSEKSFQCNQCPLAFKTYFMLKGHLTSHSNIRSYTCDICGKGFKRLNNVKEHVKSHQAKSLQCQICGNFFQRKRYLAIHEKTIHNFYADGSKPTEKGFECTVCGTKLKWKKNLMAHMRIHTGEKPYWCKICNKAFICHGALRSHMTKHDVAVEMTLPGQSQEPNAIIIDKIDVDDKVFSAGLNITTHL